MVGNSKDNDCFKLDEKKTYILKKEVFDTTSLFTFNYLFNYY